MPKSLVLGNGSMLIGMTDRGLVRDVYFPYIGLENHAGHDCDHKIGVFVDDKFSWLDDNSWQTKINYRDETLASDIHAVNKNLALEFIFTDVVYNERNIFLRLLTVVNLAEHKRNIKIFFHQQFRLFGTAHGDTAYFDPDEHAIVHYKGRRVIFVGGKSGQESFDDFSVGVAGIEGKEGTWRDAEDGRLEKNSIEHGAVDSVISFTLELAGGASGEISYWLATAHSIAAACDLHRYILQKSPAHIARTTQDFWKAWINKYPFTFYGLDKANRELFKKSLLIIRTHVDNHGGIVASADSDMLKYGRDSYSYVWMRDGAFTALALDKAGYGDLSRRFFAFCREVVNPLGFFYHKYRTDGSLGSSWHPWFKNGRKQLGIQEDETALTLWALWQHYISNRDLEFIEELYNPLIKTCADFLVDFRDPQTKLPLPSYDLWEEKYGISTFTASAVYAGLMAAQKFAALLGKDDEAKRFENAASEIKNGILKHMYNQNNGFFYKRLVVEDDINILQGNFQFTSDDTLDMGSFFGIFKFGVLEAEEPRMVKAFSVVEEWLCCKTPIGGAVRYDGDNYWRVDPRSPGNPWIITTLWFVQYYIERAQNDDDLEKVREWLKWVARFALPSGVLPEQINPLTGEQLSAAPLTWSHAEYVLTVIQYLEKLEKLGICSVCYPLR